MSKLKIVLLVSAMICAHLLIAQDSVCDVPEKIANGKLTVELANNKFESGNFGAVEAYFKMPAKSNEVNQADWISCDGYMPNGAKISSIEIISITGLPEGLKWYCVKGNCFYEGATNGCVTIEGTALEKGIYQIDINLKGVGSLWGIKRNYECLIQKFQIVVE